MPSVYPTDMLTGGILTWFGMFGAEKCISFTHCNAFVIWACAVAATIAFDFASGGMLPCLYLFWQVVSWHDLACLVHRMLLMVHCKRLWFEHLMLLSLAFDFASGGILACFDACLLIYVCQVVSLTWFGMFRLRHVLCFAFANTCARCYTEGRAGHKQEHAKSPEKQVCGVSSWFLSRLGKNTTSNSPWQPPPDNHHPTCHGGDHSK